jgi:flagellar hook-associated protein 3 FlgL
MRITNKMMSDHAVRHLSENMEQIARMQERIASGKQFSSPSEDPVGASHSLSLRSGLRTIEAFKVSTQQASDWLTATESAFQQMEDLATRAVTLVTRGLNDTLGPGERATSLATEVDGILAHALDTANSTHNGQFLFGGFKVQTPPFNMPASSTVVYQGDGGVMLRSLSPAQNVPINVLGDQAFLPFLEALVQARDALQANDTVTLRTALNGLQSALTTMNQHRTSVGARLRQVQVASDYLSKTEIETQSLLSKKEDLNLAEGISQLRGRENAYQAALEVSQRAISAMGLFDYLR